MFYRTGTATFTHGSNIVTGVDTEWLTYVSKGAFIRKQEDVDYWVVQEVLSNTELQLTEVYLGNTTANYAYTITTDKTPNLGIPIVNAFDSNPTDAINAGNMIIDMAAGSLLDYQNQKSITYSGEDVFTTRGDYHDDHLCVGRSIELLNISGEIAGYDIVQRNTIFEATINGTPVGGVVGFDNSLGSGETSLAKWDILYNESRGNHAFVKTTTPASLQLTYSGELIGVLDSWGDGDLLRVYGKTKGLGLIRSGITTSGLTLQAVSGETLASAAEFRAGELLYNYTRQTYRSITSAVFSTPYVEIITPVTVDSWVAGDIVYTVESRIQTRTNSLAANITSIKSGARVQLGDAAVKQNHIDFGFGYNQVDAGDIPCSVSGLTADNVGDGLQEVVNNASQHLTSGEAHSGSNITYVDSPTILGPTLTARNVTAAINELKTYVGIEAICYGVVDEATDSTIIDETFLLYDPSFFSGEFYLRMESGGTAGQLRKVASYNRVTAEFILSGEALTGAPLEGDQFAILRDDSWATREAFEEAFGSDSTAIVLRASQVSAQHSGLFVSGETLQDFVDFFAAGSPATATSTTVTEVGNLSGETAQDFFNQLGSNLIRPVLHETYDTYVTSAWGIVTVVLTVDPFSVHFDELVPPIPTNLAGRKAKVTYTRSGETYVSYGKFGAYVSPDWVSGRYGSYWLLTEQDGIINPHMPTGAVEEAQLELIDHFGTPGNVLTAIDYEHAEFRVPTVSGENVVTTPAGILSGETAQKMFNQIGAFSPSFAGTAPPLTIVSVTPLQWFGYAVFTTAEYLNFNLSDSVIINTGVPAYDGVKTVYWRVSGNSFCINQAYSVPATGTVRLVNGGRYVSEHSPIFTHAPYLSGEGTVWDDLQFEMSPARINPTTSKPVYDYTLECFSCASGEVLRAKGQMPHKWKEGSTIYPHCHILKNWTASRGAFSTHVTAYYKWYNPSNAVPPATWTPYVMNMISNGAVYSGSGEYPSDMLFGPGISGVGKTASSVLKFRVYNTTNPASGEVLLDAFDVHYEIDSMGSNLEYIK